MKTCLIGVGSNLGNRQKNVETAVEKIGEIPNVQRTQTSSWITSAPIGGPTDQGEFLNGVVSVATTLSPQQLLQELLEIELGLGRVRNQRWAPRLIDLDLLFVEDEVCATDSLTVPHPWMTVRPFVLEPAAEIAPDLVHPLIGWTLERLWAHLQNASNRLLLIAPSQEAGENALAQVANRVEMHVATVTSESPGNTELAPSCNSPQTSMSDCDKAWEVSTVVVNEAKESKLREAFHGIKQPKLTIFIASSQAAKMMAASTLRDFGPVLILNGIDRDRLQHDVNAALEGLS